MEKGMADFFFPLFPPFLKAGSSAIFAKDAFFLLPPPLFPPSFTKRTAELTWGLEPFFLSPRIVKGTRQEVV